MRILITWGSRMGGTEEIARILGETLEQAGHAVTLRPAREVGELADVDAVILGGGLYANRWQRDARRFVTRHARALRGLPVWFFSSGPLDDSADRAELPPPAQVGVLMERVGARGHVTFGGRLAPDARGFPAAAMARTRSGDWRNPERIRAWARDLAEALPTATPGVAVAHPAAGRARLLGHGLTGWALSASARGLLLQASSAGVAALIHLLLVPVIFALIARRYFRARGARDPLPVALTFTAMVVALDLAVVGGLFQGSLAMAGSLVAAWLPWLLVLLTTWAVGSLMATMPWPPAAARDYAARMPGASRPVDATYSS
jgi:menaquinone-dependent protoporphyrinogen oxidase